MKRPTILIDSAIPYINGIFEPYADVAYLKGDEFANAPELIATADALIIRTITKCNSTLLDGTGVRLIASATSGIDHIDTDYCSARSIAVRNAPGCNSGAVMQYVFTALYTLAQRVDIFNGRGLKGMTLGVIGVGHVGSKVADLGCRLGFRVMRCDPPKELLQKELLRAGKSCERVEYCSLDELLAASDIITLHVPSDDSTRQMVNSDFLSMAKEEIILINSSRGDVVDEEALLQCNNNLHLIIDVWKGEPEINLRLLKRTDIATPHIAGYSVEGKLNGTTAVVRACARYFRFEALSSFSLERYRDTQEIDFEGLSDEQIAKILLKIFPITEIDSTLRRSPKEFEKIRSGYKLRDEFSYRASTNRECERTSAGRQ